MKNIELNTLEIRCIKRALSERLSSLYERLNDLEATILDVKSLTDEELSRHETEENMYRGLVDVYEATYTRIKELGE